MTPTLYCERIGPGPFAEPLNALTNVVFFLAVWLAWRAGRRGQALSAGLWVLIVLATAVGVGSTLWHTLRTPWAHVLDVVPILLFQLCFLWIYGRRAVGLRRPVIVLLLALFLGAALWGRQHRAWLNGVLMYAPALLASLVVGLDHYRRSPDGRVLLVAAAGVFCGALLFRTIDLAVCGSWSSGTHFLWHALVGAVLFLYMRALMLRGLRETR